MASENALEQIAAGYKKAREGLNEERLEDWASSESDNENRGALAAIVFYGACIRECMTRGVDDPMQAHVVAGAILEFYEEDDFESVIHYLVGKPLPPRVGDMVEHYKANLKSEVDDAMEMVDNMFEIRFCDEPDLDDDGA